MEKNIFIFHKKLFFSQQKCNDLDNEKSSLLIFTLSCSPHARAVLWLFWWETVILTWFFVKYLSFACSSKNQNTTPSFDILFFSTLFFTTLVELPDLLLSTSKSLPAYRSACSTNHVMQVSQSQHDTNRAICNQSTAASTK